jgi:hypothetical protein
VDIRLCVEVEATFIPTLSHLLFIFSSLLLFPSLPFSHFDIHFLVPILLSWNLESHRSTSSCTPHPRTPKMSAPHLQTTPIPLSKSHSSRSLIPTPPQENRRRLVFGSSRKESHSQGTGYGIVSASGFRTWRRGVKGSTSASASASASAGSTTVRGTSRSGATSCVGTGTGKKGLGMGLQGTPARKRVRRDSSRKSKVSPRPSYWPSDSRGKGRKLMKIDEYRNSINSQILSSRLSANDNNVHSARCLYFHIPIQFRNRSHILPRF